MQNFFGFMQLGIDFTQKCGIVHLRKRKKGGAVLFDKKQFKVAVMLAGLTLRQVAAELNIDETTLYRKMNGESDFYRREIQQLCSILKIENPSAIFFAQEIT